MLYRQSYDVPSYVFVSPPFCTLLHSKFTHSPVQITSMYNMSYLYFNTLNIYIQYATLSDMQF